MMNPTGAVISIPRMEIPISPEEPILPGGFDFSRLNKEQKEAVKTTRGNLLLVAGAGSGKTRVIIEKIRHLCAQGVNSYNILAITFTNKAAGEMKERLEAVGIEGCWASTFHSLCSRILRKEAEHIGLSEQFSIYDTDDQKTVIRSILKELQLDPQEWKPKDILSDISNWKNSDITPEKVEASGYRERYKVRIYELYQKALKTNESLDFDDLQVKAKELLSQHTQVLEKYQRRFKYVLVDEYQDTNSIQYKLIRLLSGKSDGVTVTGDPDQSIYSWRGADIKNILNFEKDFENSNVIKLERNYRSCGHILELSNQLIRHNTERYPKNLIPHNEPGELPTLHMMSDGTSESIHIAESIRKLKDKNVPLTQIAIFYRTNYQSRGIEEHLTRAGITYIIIGGTNFLDHREIKDLIAYLRFIHNPDDSVSLMRIINKPARGISESTKSKIKSFAEDNGLSCWDAMRHPALIGTQAARTQKSIAAFNQMVAGFFELSLGSPDQLLDRVITSTKIMDIYHQDSEKDEESRAYIQEFMAYVTEFCSKNRGATLTHLLEGIALMTDKHDDQKENHEAVTLMTLHAAKGLEYPYVFIAGVDENLLPHSRSIDIGTRTALEEERRLFYVGITRAEHILHLYSAEERQQYDRVVRCKVSRFIAEIEGPHLVIDRGGRRHEPPPEKPSRFSMKALDGQSFRKGEPVRHKKHGKGIVLQVHHSGLEEEVHIFFEKVGPITLRMQDDHPFLISLG